jgi:SAM-dependent methyltransferase
MSSQDTWSGLHEIYKKEDWINKPSLFAQEVLEYLPKTGSLLELGAGQGQDSRYFAEQGYQVLSTDISQEGLRLSQEKTAPDLLSKMKFQQVDLSNSLPFEKGSFDIVYAHLSLHYFTKERTLQLFSEINEVLKPNGMISALFNTVEDPEYQSGTFIEEDYFDVKGVAKRYFSVENTKPFISKFETVLLDKQGSTYKDRAKNIHHLIRFIGKKK